MIKFIAGVFVITVGVVWTLVGAYIVLGNALTSLQIDAPGLEYWLSGLGIFGSTALGFLWKTVLDWEDSQRLTHEALNNLNSLDVAIDKHDLNIHQLMVEVTVFEKRLDLIVSMAHNPSDIDALISETRNKLRDLPAILNRRRNSDRMRNIINYFGSAIKKLAAGSPHKKEIESLLNVFSIEDKLQHHQNPDIDFPKAG
jgi:hypothetical protein